MLASVILAATLSCQGVDARFVELPAWMPTDVPPRFIPYGLDGTNETRRVTAESAAAVRAIVDGLAERLESLHDGGDVSRRFFHQGASAEAPYVSWPQSRRFVQHPDLRNAVDAMRAALSAADPADNPFYGFTSQALATGAQTDYWPTEWTPRGDARPVFPRSGGMCAEVPRCWPVYGRDGEVRIDAQSGPGAYDPPFSYFVQRFAPLGTNWTDSARAVDDSPERQYVGLGIVDAMRTNGLAFANVPGFNFLQWCVHPRVTQRLDWDDLGAASATVAVLRGSFAEGDDSCVYTNMTARATRSREYTGGQPTITYTVGIDPLPTLQPSWGTPRETLDVEDGVSEYRFTCPFVSLSPATGGASGGGLAHLGDAEVDLGTLETFLTGLGYGFWDDYFGLSGAGKLFYRTVEGSVEFVGVKILNDYTPIAAPPSYETDPEALLRGQTFDADIHLTWDAQIYASGEYSSGVDLSNTDPSLWPDFALGRVAGLRVDAFETVLAATNALSGFTQELGTFDDIPAERRAGAWYRARPGVAIDTATAGRRTDAYNALLLSVYQRMSALAGPETPRSAVVARTAFREGELAPPGSMRTQLVYDTQPPETNTVYAAFTWGYGVKLSWQPIDNDPATWGGADHSHGLAVGGVSLMASGESGEAALERAPALRVEGRRRVIVRRDAATRCMRITE